MKTLQLLIVLLLAGLGLGCSGSTQGSEPPVKGNKPEMKTATPDMKSPEERGREAGGGGEGS